MNAEDFLSHLQAQFGIEIRQRLIEQQQIRPNHQRPREGHALLLPTRKLVGHLLRPLLHLHNGQSFGYARLFLGRAQGAHFQAVNDILRNSEMGPERVILEYHAGVAAMRRHVIHWSVSKENLAAIRLIEACDQAQQGRLAAARRPKQKEKLLRTDFQGNVLQDCRAAKSFRQVPD